MPRKAANVPANETNAQRFARIVNHRVNIVLTQLKGIGNLNGTQYESKPEQRKKIAEALKAGVDASMTALEKGTPVQEFKL